MKTPVSNIKGLLRKKPPTHKARKLINLFKRILLTATKIIFNLEKSITQGLINYASKLQ